MTAGALGALAVAATLHPLAGIAALACGAGLAVRHLREGRGQGGPFALKLGTEVDGKRKVALSRDDARDGILVTGTAGSGRRTFLLGLAREAVEAGAGLAYVDGSGDPGMHAKVEAIARLHGREDDLLVLDLAGAGADGRRTHSFNPLARGPVDGTVQFLADTLSFPGGDGAMWKGKAVSLLHGLVGTLTWMRDHGDRMPDIGTLCGMLPLGVIIRLAEGSAEPGLPEHERRMLAAYLTTLPGYDPALGEAQPQVARDQHGYLEMLVNLTFRRLAGKHPGVFRPGVPDVDMTDVVLNGRILLVLLPSLEKCGDEDCVPAKVVVSALKRALAGSLIGTDADVSSASGCPFLCVLDEYGYYAVEGFAQVARMAGTNGFSTAYAADDLPALRRLDEREAASVYGRTATKVFTRTEEMDATSGCERRAGVHEESEPDFSVLHKLPPEEGIVTTGDRKVRARLVGFDMPVARHASRPERVSALMVPYPAIQDQDTGR